MSDNRIDSNVSQTRVVPAWFEWEGQTLELAISPESISYSYNMGYNSQDTKGGRVIQVLSQSIGDMTIQGKVIPKYTNYGERYETMKNIEAKVRSIMTTHTTMKKDSNGNEYVSGTPVNFSFTPEGWSGKVWLKSFGNVQYSINDNVFSYSMTMQVVKGFDALKKVGAISALERLSDVNWVRDSYHMTGGNKEEEVKKMLQELFASGGYTGQGNSSSDSGTLGQGQTIEIPQDLAQTGIIADFTVYPQFHGRWASGTNQQKVDNLWGDADCPSADNCATLNNRYLIAMNGRFGEAGQKVDVQLEDGTVINATLADEKRGVGGDSNSGEWGHIYGGKTSLVEFEAMNMGFQPPDKWKGKNVKKVVNCGNESGI